MAILNFKWHGVRQRLTILNFKSRSPEVCIQNIAPEIQNNLYPLAQRSPEACI